MVTRTPWKTPLLRLDALVRCTNMLLAIGGALSAGRMSHVGAWLAMHGLLAVSVTLIARADVRSGRATDRLTIVDRWPRRVSSVRAPDAGDRALRVRSAARTVSCVAQNMRARQPGMLSRALVHPLQLAAA